MERSSGRPIPAPVKAPSESGAMSFALHGIGVSRGIAVGRAQLISHATLEVAHYTIPQGRVDAEIGRFANALNEVQRELEALRGSLSSDDTPAEVGAFI